MPMERTEARSMPIIALTQTAVTLASFSDTLYAFKVRISRATCTTRRTATCWKRTLN
jgi:hypothetical protein